MLVVIDCALEVTLILSGKSAVVIYNRKRMALVFV